MKLLTENNIYMLARIFAFCIALPFHELAHGFVSYKQGDPTAKNAGRITLNPFKHIDPMGAISLLLVGIGWAKPVPIDPRYYKNPKKGMAITAAAGPISNLLLAYVSMVVYKLLLFIARPPLHISAVTPGTAAAYVLVNLFAYFAVINVSLAVFNMLPFPPFDGSRIFLSFLPEGLYFKIQRYERYMMMAVMALVFFGAFNGVLSAVNKIVFDLLDLFTKYIDIIFR